MISVDCLKHNKLTYLFAEQIVLMINSNTDYASQNDLRVPALSSCHCSSTEVRKPVKKIWLEFYRI